MQYLQWGSALYWYDNKYVGNVFKMLDETFAGNPFENFVLVLVFNALEEVHYTCIAENTLEMVSNMLSPTHWSSV
jgi:hypothetical protein